jgi:hypothetical protein
MVQDQDGPRSKHKTGYTTENEVPIPRGQPFHPASKHIIFGGNIAYKRIWILWYRYRYVYLNSTVKRRESEMSARKLFGDSGRTLGKGHEDEVNAPRDASGLAIANNWRNIINFGGIHYYDHYNITKPGGETKQRQSRRRFSTVRSLGVCAKTWSKVGDLSVRTFALQTSVSAKLNVAISCRGHTFSNRCNVTDDQIPGMIFSD